VTQASKVIPARKEILVLPVILAQQDHREIPVHRGPKAILG
jgi:hypothetical protein